MNLERCTECNGKLISNTAMGHTVCSQCGLVNEERQVVSNSGFSEIGASGFFMDSNSSRAKSSSQPFSKFSNSTLDESQKHQLTLQNGNSRISEIATCLKLPTRVAEIAERNFALAVANGFTKGKRVAVVAACCLYIVCRLEKMSFMLMDFSQVLDINVYIIGSTYMKLVIKLQLRDSISHIDPALFVQRYAEGLEFDEKKPLVINDCLRLIMRMDRDWMKLGRSPAGICAAALFIAARMNGFNRTPQEIVSVVKICQGTLRKRLDEFANTPSSKLTVNEFKTSWIEESQDPPCFRPIDPEANESSKEASETPIATETRASTAITESNNTQIEPEIEINADPIQEEENEESIANQMDIALTDTHIQTVLNSLETTVGEDLSFLDDDKEVSSALLTPAEIEFKSEIWSSLNWEFLKNQNEKKVVGVKEIRGKRKRKELVLIEGETVLDSVQQMIRAKAPVLSSKINYDALSEMFEVEEE